MLKSLFPSIKFIAKSFDLETLYVLANKLMLAVSSHWNFCVVLHSSVKTILIYDFTSSLKLSC